MKCTNCHDRRIVCRTCRNPSNRHRYRHPFVEMACPECVETKSPLERRAYQWFVEAYDESASFTPPQGQTLMDLLGNVASMFASSEVKRLEDKILELQATQTLPPRPCMDNWTDEARATVRSLEICYASAVQNLEPMRHTMRNVQSVMKQLRRTSPDPYCGEGPWKSLDQRDAMRMLYELEQEVDRHLPKD